MKKKDILEFIKKNYKGDTKAFYKDYPTLESFKNGGKLPKYNHGGLHYEFNGKSYGDSTADTFGADAGLNYSFNGQSSITNDQGGANAGHYTGGNPYANTGYANSESAGMYNTAAVTAGMSSLSNLSQIDPNLSSEQKKSESIGAIEGGVESGANSIPWYQAASMASEFGKNQIKRDANGNPVSNTGKTADDWMTASHKTGFNNLKEGDYSQGAAEFMGGQQLGRIGGDNKTVNAIGKSFNYFANPASGGIEGIGAFAEGEYGRGLASLAGPLGSTIYNIFDPNEPSKEKDPNQKSVYINPYDANGNLDPKGTIARTKQHQKATKTFDTMKANALNPQTKSRVQGDDTLGWMKFGGNLNVFNYNGNSHKQGGINVNAQGLPTKQFGGQPVAEVEGGETMAKLEQGGNTPFIFSDKLKPLSSKKTFAELHKPLVNMEKRMTKNAERVSSNPISKESQERMKERIMNNTKSLAQEQEQLKMMKDMKSNPMYAKYGGRLPKYYGGGDVLDNSSLEKIPVLDDANYYDFITNKGYTTEEDFNNQLYGSITPPTGYTNTPTTNLVTTQLTNGNQNYTPTKKYSYLSPEGYSAINKFENTSGKIGPNGVPIGMNMGDNYAQTGGNNPQAVKDLETYIDNNIGRETWDKLPDNIKTQFYAASFNSGGNTEYYLKGLAQAVGNSDPNSKYYGDNSKDTRNSMSEKDALDIIRNADYSNDNVYNNYLSILGQQMDSVGKRSGFPQKYMDEAFSRRAQNIDSYYQVPKQKVSNNLDNTTPYNPSYKTNQSIFDLYPQTTTTTANQQGPTTTGTGQGNGQDKGYNLNQGIADAASMYDIFRDYQLGKQKPLPQDPIYNPRNKEILSEIDSSKKALGEYSGYNMKEQEKALRLAGEIANQRGRDLSGGSSARALAHTARNEFMTASSINKLREQYENQEKNKKLQISQAYSNYAQMLNQMGMQDLGSIRDAKNLDLAAQQNVSKYQESAVNKGVRYTHDRNRNSQLEGALAEMYANYTYDPKTGKLTPRTSTT